MDSSSKVFEAKKQFLLDKVKSIEKQIDLLRKNVIIYGNSMGEMSMKIEQIAVAITEIEDFKEHEPLYATLKQLKPTILEVSNQQKYCEDRTARIVPQDMEKFINSWRLIKKWVRTFCEATPRQKIMNLLKRKEWTKEQEIQNQKEKKQIEIKIFQALSDLNNCMEEFLHAQMQYHAKALESWYKVWHKMHKKKARPPHEDDDDDNNKEKKKAKKKGENGDSDDEDQDDKDDDDKKEKKDEKGKKKKKAENSDSDSDNEKRKKKSNSSDDDSDSDSDKKKKKKKLSSSAIITLDTNRKSGKNLRDIIKEKSKDKNF